MDKYALYTSITLATLLGYGANKDKDNFSLELRFRNQYPRFVLTLSTDTTIPYNDRTITIQMSSQILTNIADGILSAIDGEGRTIIIRYPDYDGGDLTKQKVLAEVFFYSDGINIIIGIKARGEVYTFPVTGDRLFFDIVRDGNVITNTKEISYEYAKTYAENLKSIATVYPMVYASNSANKVEIKR